MAGHEVWIMGECKKQPDKDCSCLYSPLWGGGGLRAAGRATLPLSARLRDAPRALDAEAIDLALHRGSRA